MIPLVLLFLSVFIVRNRPSDIGQAPYGLDSASEEQQDVSKMGMEYKDAIKTRSFWSIAVIAMFTFYCLLGLQANLILHLQDLGFDIKSAAAGLAMLFTPALIGKFVFGLIADKVDSKKVLYSNLILMLLGIIALIYADKSTVLWCVALIGLAWGVFIRYSSLMQLSVLA
mgnify:CR=1 FL=1